MLTCIGYQALMIDTMTPLRAHPNVIDMAENRREREQRRATSSAVRFQFVGWSAEMLTSAEIAALRREAKETSAFARKAFAHLRPPPSHPAAQALLAGLMQDIGERERDSAMVDAGRRLAQAATRGLPPQCPQPPWWRRWWR